MTLNPPPMAETVDPLLPPTGLFAGGKFHYPLRVYFEDTDAGGIVYHANYLRWFERARTEMVRSLGVDQKTAIASGDGAYAVTDLAIRYVRPARLGDAIVVESTVTAARAATWRVCQQAMCGADLLAQADVRIGFIDPGGKPRAQPAHWRKALQTVLNSESAS